jgi:hypothetical protein
LEREREGEREEGREREGEGGREGDGVREEEGGRERETRTRVMPVRLVAGLVRVQLGFS